MSSDEVAVPSQTTPSSSVVGTITRAAPSRLAHVDVLRGLAAVVITAHHIAAYGALPDIADNILPLVIDWAWEYGRLAVQVFFVISGLVTALALGRSPVAASGLTRFAVRRYIRLGFPYLTVIVCVLALGAVVTPNQAAFPLSDSPTIPGLLAHAVFLQDVLGFGGLSAGFWYLAIDFQFGLLFYLLMIVHAALARSISANSPRLDGALLMLVSAPLAVASVYSWNRVPSLETWVIYHLGPLLLGAACGWAIAGRITTIQFAAFAAILAAGLLIEFRIRLVVALTAVILIYVFARGRPKLAPRSALLALGSISYSLFLVHYPTVWTVESLGKPFWEGSPSAALLGMAAAFAASLVVAVVFYRLVERPTVLLAEHLRPRLKPS